MDIIFGCWGCKGNGSVLNYAGIPIECPICDSSSPFYKMSKRQYKRNRK